MSSPAMAPPELLIALLIGLLTLALAHYRSRGKRFPDLTKTWSEFPVTSVRLVNDANGQRQPALADRPILFITVGTSTAHLPTGAHVKIKKTITKDGKLEEIMRAYTPTKFDNGQCELMIRCYEGGALTPELYKVKKGDTLTMMGPTGLHRYGPKPGELRVGGGGGLCSRCSRCSRLDCPLFVPCSPLFAFAPACPRSRSFALASACLVHAMFALVHLVHPVRTVHTVFVPGHFTAGRRSITCSHIGMLAGGTGVTPMIQIVNSILSDPADHTTVTLVVFSTTGGDIMMFDRLNSIAASSKNAVQISFVVSKPLSSAEKTKFGPLQQVSMRSLDRGGILKLLGIDGENENESVVCQCGPEGFTKHVKGQLKDLGDQLMTW